MENNNEIKEIELSECSLEFATGGQDAASGQEPPITSQVPGMPCPVCKGFIPTTIQYIISHDSLSCPHCGLVITIDKTKSHKAIEAFRKVQEAQENIERKKREQAGN